MYRKDFTVTLKCTSQRAVKCTYLAQDKDEWQVVVSRVLKASWLAERLSGSHDILCLIASVYYSARQPSMNSTIVVRVGKNRKARRQDFGRATWKKHLEDQGVDGRIILKQNLIICGNKMPTRCKRWFLLQILLLVQHVSGTIMPIIRSSRVLYKGLQQPLV